MRHKMAQVALGVLVLVLASCGRSAETEVAATQAATGAPGDGTPSQPTELAARKATDTPTPTVPTTSPFATLGSRSAQNTPQPVSIATVAGSGISLTEDRGEPTTAPPVRGGENLLANPYFEGCHNCTDIAGWVNDGQWDISAKAHNPSPNDTAARCTKPEVHGSCPTGGPAYLFQVVAADPAWRRLQFSISYILNRAEAAATIYGGPTSGGPWTLVWEAWSGSLGGPGEWENTGLRETTIEHGFLYYKLELYGKFNDRYDQGVKLTDAFFSVQP